MTTAIARWMHMGVALTMVGALTGTPRAAPQDGQSAATTTGATTTYRVSELTALGGTPNRANSLNDLGWATGYAVLADGSARHAMLWAHGHPFDLGTLGGFNSSVTWPVKNNLGLIVGISQTAEPDPLGEEWSCGSFFSGPNATGQVCRGFAWAFGFMRRMPTLGGTHSFATGANNLGQVVGWAENAIQGDDCVGKQKLRFQAVIWDPFRNRLQELPRHGDDTSSAATAINDRGQVVGISGICDQAVGRLTAKHAVLWERGTVTHIGNLGGLAWNTPMSINRHGDIAGFAGEAGDDPYNPAPRFEAFVSTRGEGIKRLKRLAGHVSAQANSINGRGQIVGTSCPASGSCRAVMWHGSDEPIDLTLRTRGFDGVLEQAQDINERGQISGRLARSGSTQRMAFIATPSSR